MDNHSLEVLEFSAIREILGSFAFSEPGRKLCYQISPQLARNWIEKALSETQQVKEAISLHGRMPLSGLKDINPIVNKANLPGSCLDVDELFEILN